MSITIKKGKGGIEYTYFSYYDKHESKKKEVYCGPNRDPDSTKKATALIREYLRGCISQLKQEQDDIEKQLATLEPPKQTSGEKPAREIIRNAPVYEPKVHFKSSKKMSEVPDGSVQLVVTSPPSLHNEYKGYATYGEDTGKLEVYLDFLDGVWAECNRILCKGGRIAIAVEDGWRTVQKQGRSYIPLHVYITERMLNRGFLMRGIIYWNKDKNFEISARPGSLKSPSNPTIRGTGEYILVFSKDSLELESHNRTATITSKEFAEYTKSIWTFAPSNRAKKGSNPASAPIPEELVQRLINLYTYMGDTILDPFLASGTVCKVAKEWSRKSIGYEIDKAHRTEIQDNISKDGLATRYRKLVSWSIDRS